jgi:chemotaxis protein histidine kinase CheA
MSADHRRLTHALLLSLLIHSLLLSLTFGGQGLWLPGFNFPWRDRRIEAPDLRVAVLPRPVAAVEPAVAPVAAPLQQAWDGQPIAIGPALSPSMPLGATARPAAAAMTPEASPRAEGTPRTEAATGAATAQMSLRADRPGDTAPPPIPAPAVIALPRSDEAAWVVPAPPDVPAPVIVAAPSASSPEAATRSLQDAGDAARARIDQEAREQAAEPAGLDPAKQEGRRKAEQLEASRQDADRQEAARVEVARAEAAKVEAAKVEAAKVEAAKVEAAKVEAAKVEAAKVEAARIEAARAEAARAEAARSDSAKVEAAKVEVAQEATARREAALRAIGRQLDEEAARREAATGAARLPPSSSSARRYRLFGRTDSNAELILYVEAWSRKIQLNMTFEMVREAAKQPHKDPLVTVAIRSDGSVESVTFVQSSGVAALDEAIRRVIHSQTPYQVFPPGLAREFDVIEIRRTWYFDMAIRLY